MSYPTQEDELRAREAHADEVKAAEQSKFLLTFQTVPKNNVDRLSGCAHEIVEGFDVIMEQSRQEPFERQEDLMAGMKKLLHEEIAIIEARRVYTMKINPSTANRIEKSETK